MAAQGTGEVLASLVSIIEAAQQQLQGQHGQSTSPLQQQGQAASGAGVPDAQKNSMATASHSTQPSGSEQVSGEAGSDLLDLARKAMAAGRGVGPKLQDLRSKQLADGVPLEEYNLVHAQRLFMYLPCRRWEGKKVHCRKVHGSRDERRAMGLGPCTECFSCHGCRQKLLETMTVCSRCHGNTTEVGGPSRGHWCGSCLRDRVGENKDEVMQLTDWLCPGCRDVCTCSADNCKRTLRKWLPTGQLSGEAGQQGYMSIAHYLVFNHLSSDARAASLGPAIPLPKSQQRQQQAQNLDGTVLERSLPKKQHNERLLYDAEALYLRELRALAADMGMDLQATGLEMPSAAAAMSLGSHLPVTLGLVAAPVCLDVQPAAADSSFGLAALVAQDLEAGDEDNIEEEEEGSDISGLPRGFAQRCARQVPARDWRLRQAVDSTSCPKQQSAVLQAGPQASPVLPLGTSAAQGTALVSSGANAGPSSTPSTSPANSTSPAGSWYKGLLPPRQPALHPTQPHPQLQCAAPAAASAGPAQHMLPTSGPLGAQSNIAAASAVSVAPTATVAGSTAATTSPERAEDRKRKRDQLEGLLQPESAAGVQVHEGVPGAGVAAGGARPRPSVAAAAAGQKQRQTHIAPHLPPKGAAARDVLQQQSADVAGATARELSTRRTSPAERSSGLEPDFAMADVADPSGQLRLLPAGQTGASTSHMSAASMPETASAAASAVPSLGQAALSAPPAQRQAPAAKLLPGPLARAASPFNQQTAAGADAAAAQCDALAWSSLYKRVAGALEEPHSMLHRLSTSVDNDALTAQYNESYEHCISQLKLAMRKAEHMLRQLDEPLVLREHDWDSGRHQSGCDFLFTHAGLRSCLRVYCLLARVLEPADVQSYIVRRVLSQDPFVDFGRSDVAARYDLLKAWLQLAFALHEGGLPEGDALAAVAQGLTCVAGNLGQANQVLDELYKLEPPAHGLTIGHWQFDESQKLHEAFQLLVFAIRYWRGILHIVLRLLLGLLQGTIPGELAHEFELPRSVPKSLALRACGLLTKDLVGVLLNPALRLGSADVRKDALLLLPVAMDCAGSPGTAPDITSVMVQQQRMAERQLAEVVKEVAVPLLEAAVAQEFPFWRGPSTAGGAAPEVQRPAGDSDECRELHGYDKVDTLAHCYGFLVASGILRWEQVEAALGRPYTFSYFWNIASSLYRLMAVSMVAVIVQRAPKILEAPHACVSILRLWVSALLDRKGRPAAQQLTLVLASNASTSLLFSGIQPEELRQVVEDSTGEVRARLLATVVRNMAIRPGWCGQLGPVLGSLPEVLQARSREIKDHGSRPGEALVMWQVATSAMVLGMVREVPLHGPGRPSSGVDAATAGKLKSLLGCIADWALKSCPLALGSFTGQAGKDGGREAGPDAAHQQPGPELRGGLRAVLKVTVFGQLTDVWQQLLAWGAPAQLDTDKALLQPLWTVVASCMEMCPGALQPSPQEQVLLEVLAQSFAPMAATQQPTAANPGPPAPLLHPLCTYVLSTFVRRYLSRAGFQHHSNQRAAVVALRFVEALLDEPSMRSTNATLATLRPLLRPFMLLLEPAQSAAAFEASLAVREQLYSLLANLLKSSPERAALLQPASPPSQQPHAQGSQRHPERIPQQQQDLLAALRSVFQHAAQDVLQYVEAAVRCGGAGQQLVSNLLQKVGPKGACTAPLAAPEKQQWGKALNLLRDVSKLHPLDALEQLYTHHGEGLLRATVAGASGPAGQGLFRPGNFLWTVAERGMQFVGALASSGADPQLALACFPVIHFLVLGTGKHGKSLQKAYKALRGELEQALGPAALQPWPINTRADTGSGAAAAQQVPQPSLPQPQPMQAPQQLRPQGAPRQPQVPQAGPTAVVAYTGGGSEVSPPSQPSLSLAATASSSQGMGQKRRKATMYSSDQCIYNLSLLEVGAELPVTALLQTGSAAMKEQAKRGASLLLVLLDYSGPDGSDQLCRVEVGKVELKEQLLSGVPSGDVRREPVVLRLTHLRLLARKDQSISLLKCSSRAKIEIQPVSATADALRSRARQGAGQRQPVLQQQHQQPAGRASPPSPSIGSVRPALPPSHRGMHALGSAPTVAYHHSQTQDAVGVSQHVIQGPAKRPAPATTAAGQGPAAKRRCDEAAPVMCSQAGPPVAAARQAQRHAAPGTAQPTAKPAPTSGGAGLGPPESGTDLAQRARLQHASAIFGHLESQGHSRDAAKWGVGKIPWSRLDLQEAVRLAGIQLQLVQQAVRQLEGMGYSKGTAEEAVRQVWRQDVPVPQLVQLAVESLIA